MCGGKNCWLSSLIARMSFSLTSCLSRPTRQTSNNSYVTRRLRHLEGFQALGATVPEMSKVAGCIAIVACLTVWIAETACQTH